VQRSVIFVTGTDTGVGKTVVSCLLAGELRRQGRCVPAVKPVSSGGREDGRRLRAAGGGILTLDEVNPWHFREGLAPVLAARKQGRRLKQAEVEVYLRRLRRRFAALIIEGAGGLLSPLGEDFDSLGLIVAMRAQPVVVCPNRLGAIGQCRLVLAALPHRVAHRAQVVLVSTPGPDPASRTNPRLLAEWFGRERIHVLPRLKHPRQPQRDLNLPSVRRALRSLTRALGF
jgi:dethiobiotin synthetase